MSRLTPEERDALWDMFEAGVPFKKIGRQLGRQHSTVRAHIRYFGGKRPRPACSELRLSLEEREEISRGLAGGLSLRAIACELGRAPSTVSREVHANGGQRAYRALVANRAARRRRRRPKARKLATCPRLRAKVEAKLEARWSPEEISGWLARTYPTMPEMQVSHETIYQSLFVQGKGSLRKELHYACEAVGPCAGPRVGPRPATVWARSRAWSISQSAQPRLKTAPCPDTGRETSSSAGA